jgi:hypothetical protein
VPATTDADALLHFLGTEVLPWFESRKKDMANRPLILEQAFGERSTPSKSPTLLSRIIRWRYRNVHQELWSVLARR